MSNVINLERDMLWVDYSAPIGFAAPSALGNGMSVSTSGVVGQIVASFQTVQLNYIGAGSPFQVRAAGVQILPPADGDIVPYRLKGSAYNSRFLGLFGCGRLTGGVIQRYQLLSGGNSIDDVIAIPPLQVGDADFASPLVFFYATPSDVSGQVFAVLSVQRLLAKPPQFASAVS